MKEENIHNMCPGPHNALIVLLERVVLKNKIQSTIVKIVLADIIVKVEIHARLVLLELIQN